MSSPLVSAVRRQLLLDEILDNNNNNNNNNSNNNLSNNISNNISNSNSNSNNNSNSNTTEKNTDEKIGLPTDSNFSIRKMYEGNFLAKHFSFNESEDKRISYLQQTPHQLSHSGDLSLLRTAGHTQSAKLGQKQFWLNDIRHRSDQGHRRSGIPSHPRDTVAVEPQRRRFDHSELLRYGLICQSDHHHDAYGLLRKQQRQQGSGFW